MDWCRVSLSPSLPLPLCFFLVPFPSSLIIISLSPSLQLYSVAPSSPSARRLSSISELMISYSDPSKNVADPPSLAELLEVLEPMRIDRERKQAMRDGTAPVSLPAS